MNNFYNGVEGKAIVGKSRCRLWDSSKSRTFVGEYHMPYNGKLTWDDFY